MAESFQGFSHADAQLMGVKAWRNEVSATWADKLRLVISAACKSNGSLYQIKQDGLEWAYYDAYHKLLLGKVEPDYAPDGCYLSALSNAELLAVQQRTLKVITDKPLGTGLVPESILRQLIA